MCFAAIGPLLSVVGTVMSAGAAQAKAGAEANQLAYNAAVAKINANTARQEGQARSDTIAQKYRAQAGHITAAYGRAGVVPTSGSPDLVLAENRRNEWLDINNTIWGKNTEALGQENKAADLEAQARAVRQAGSIGVATSFLTGIAGLYKGMGGYGAGTTPLIDSGYT